MVEIFLKKDFFPNFDAYPWYHFHMVEIFSQFFREKITCTFLPWYYCGMVEIFKKKYFLTLIPIHGIILVW